MSWAHCQPSNEVGPGGTDGSAPGGAAFASPLLGLIADGTDPNAARDDAGQSQAIVVTAKPAPGGFAEPVPFSRPLLGLAIAFLIARGIIRPLSGLTAGMKELAGGNFGVVLPGLDRKDEVGDMAQAVETFKVKAEEKAREEAEAKIKQDEVLARQRKAEMAKMADDFEGAVGRIVSTVSSASSGRVAFSSRLRR